MSQKNLTDAAWEKFAKGRNRKDVARPKALADQDQDQDQATTPQADMEFTARVDLLDKSVGKPRQLMSELSAQF